MISQAYSVKLSFYKLYSFPSFRKKIAIPCVYIQHTFLNRNNMILYVVCQKPVKWYGIWDYLVRPCITWYAFIPHILEKNDLHMWSLSWNTWISHEGGTLSQIFWKYKLASHYFQVIISFAALFVVAACCFTTSWLSCSKLFKILSGVSLDLPPERFHFLWS